MKIFIMAGLLLAMASPYRCADENENTTETETNEGGYDASDTKARNAIADWEKFLIQSDAVVNDACIKISKATDKLEYGGLKHTRRFKSAIIMADERMEKLSDMLLLAKRIKPENYRFDEPAMRDIERFKQEFKSRQYDLDEALKELETK